VSSLGNVLATCCALTGLVIFIALLGSAEPLYRIFSNDSEVSVC